MKSNKYLTYTLPRSSSSPENVEYNVTLHAIQSQYTEEHLGPEVILFRMNSIYTRQFTFELSFNVHLVNRYNTLYLSRKERVTFIS